MKTKQDHHKIEANGQKNKANNEMPTVATGFFTEQDRNLFATIADAALKAGGWQMLDAVNHWRNKIDSLTK